MEKEQTKDKYVDLGKKESKKEVESVQDDFGLPTMDSLISKEVEPMQNDMAMPTMDSVMPTISIEDVFDTSLLPRI